MSFGESIATCFRKYGDFTGRASRPEFWWFLLFTWLVEGVAFALMRPNRYAMNPRFTLLALVWLALFIPYLAAGVRRLHDTGRSGAYLLLVFIPLVGAIMLIVFWASEGGPLANVYGEPVTR